MDLVNVSARPVPCSSTGHFLATLLTYSPLSALQTQLLPAHKQRREEKVLVLSVSAHGWMIWPELTEKTESRYKTEREICSSGKTWAKSFMPQTLGL